MYEGGGAFDEAFDGDGEARAHYRGIVGVLESFTQTEIERRERLQKLSLMDQGITFTVYGEKEGTERIFPLDRKSTRLNSSHLVISYAVFCLKKKKKTRRRM